MTRGLGGHSPANVTHSLKGLDFPARKQDLIRHAKSNGAEGAMIEVIEKMPDDEYRSMADVMKGVGRVE